MENNLAVLIDFENIAAGTEKEGLGRFDVEALMQRVKDKGRILVARSYADWGRFSRFKQSLLTANVTMMELTSHGMQDKNRADIAMVVDALELAFTKDYIHTFVVVSGDSDFTPLVLKMRELNKRVIGIGTRKSTSRLLIQACDEFVFYDSVVQTKAPRRHKAEGQPKEISSAFELLAEALGGLLRESPDPPLASVVKAAALRKGPDFNESDLGFSSFGRFLEAAQDAGVVRLIRDQKSGGYRVFSPEEDDKDGAEPLTEEVSSWRDPYLPAGSEVWIDTLGRLNLHILGAPIRMAVLEALVSVVAERSKKRHKTTVQYVREDVKKKLRRTHPDLPSAQLSALINALMIAGEFLHRDGSAIRSGKAPFNLAKDAEGLNESLVRLYLSQLRAEGCDLSDTAALAELMYGDTDRRREVEETLAYLVTEGEPADLDLDLEDLLEPVGFAHEPSHQEHTNGAESPVDNGSDGIPVDWSGSVDDLLVEEPPAEEAPKKKRTRRTRKAAEGEEAAPAEKRPRRRKQTEERSDEISDLDMLLEPSSDN